jgi:hypothetical protein
VEAVSVYLALLVRMELQMALQAAQAVLLDFIKVSLACYFA